MALINGTSGHDVLKGTPNPDEMNGFGGNDQLLGSFGNDTLNGGSGTDQLFGSFGDDQLNGGSGNDILKGGDGIDGLKGGTGADYMDGGAQDDTYFVDNVNDVAEEFFSDALSGVDVVESFVTHTLGQGIENLILTGFAAINGTGNEKNNDILGNDATNVLNGGDGNDTLNSGYSGNDTLIGGNGNDSLSGGIGDDLLNGGAGTDTMFGFEGNDTYIIDNIGDVAKEFWDDSEGGINDSVEASITYTLGFGFENLLLTGSTAINGTGNGNRNVITGNGVNNVLSGLDGNDHLHGNGGNDLLIGGNGNDLLIGGAGADTLAGGLGTDIFRYTSVSDGPAGAGKDLITDFKGNGPAAGDKIDLAAIDANTAVTGNQAFIFGGPHTAGHLWYAGGVLNANIDNDTTVEFQIQLAGAPAVHLTDILL